MDRDAFDLVFQREIVDALVQAGFRSRGKTVFLSEPEVTIALIRLGGRFTLPGSIAHVLCFRHTYLRGTQQDEANLTTPSDYMFKFRPSEIQNTAPATWHYDHRTLQWGYDRFEYAPLTRDSVEATLRDLATFLGKVFVPWARALSPEAAAEQIRSFGKDAWCEKRWLEDYAAHATLSSNAR